MRFCVAPQREQTNKARNADYITLENIFLLWRNEWTLRIFSLFVVFVIRLQDWAFKCEKVKVLVELLKFFPCRRRCCCSCFAHLEIFLRRFVGGIFVLWLPRLRYTFCIILRLISNDLWHNLCVSWWKSIENAIAISRLRAWTYYYYEKSERAICGDPQIEKESWNKNWNEKSNKKTSFYVYICRLKGGHKPKNRTEKSTSLIDSLSDQIKLSGHQRLTKLS